jgi:acyl-CoA thioester hydrolase
MSKTPIVFRTTHRIRFSDLDPYNHMSTARYAAYFIDHRIEGVREHLGWGVSTLGTLPFMLWVRTLQIDFVRSARGDQEITIESFVREFRGPDAHIDCTMLDSDGKTLSRCRMIVAHVDRQTKRATDWPRERMALFFELDRAGDAAPGAAHEVRDHGDRGEEQRDVDHGRGHVKDDEAKNPQQCQDDPEDEQHGLTGFNRRAAARSALA